MLAPPTERARGLLRFVVERKLEGCAGQIKESVIAVEVLGRTTSFNSKSDPIVRVEAGRLRDRRSSYYESEGAADPILISLRKGSGRSICGASLEYPFARTPKPRDAGRLCVEQAAAQVELMKSTHPTAHPFCSDHGFFLCPYPEAGPISSPSAYVLSASRDALHPPPAHTDTTGAQSFASPG